MKAKKLKITRNEVFEMFCEHLNETNQPIKIGATVLEPSEVLKETRPQQFLLELQEFEYFLREDGEYELEGGLDGGYDWRGYKIVFNYQKETYE